MLESGQVQFIPPHVNNLQRINNYLQQPERGNNVTDFGIDSSGTPTTHWAND